MIKAIIIEDEQHCVQRLQGLLQQQAPLAVRVVAVAGSVAEGLQAIREHRPQLVFLDIQLQEQTAFDLLGQLEQKDFEIIFTTAYDQYAVPAFRFSALDYLLKPIDPDQLQEALTRITGRQQDHHTAARLDALLHNLKDLQGATKKICVPVMNGLVFVQVSDIIRCQSQVNYTTFYLKDGQTMVVAKTLKEFEGMLNDYNFFRVHNSHLVNIAYIKSYNKGKGGYVVMSDDSEVEVSSRRKEAFLKKLME
ncbi:MAG: LytTR family DNA-binding domain-containing protein [Candidatus Pseudobacter hemicellulosilyticus]|uniref:LytTR family DNA-binding domain-containing protein n=1 Tax=Candidatus Pseudobacter hemicellulosilyticus TaxID=3121375 RepID=A0AAJ5WUW7_9BACT|nr:MAG: LytTR family DNA-binding domain-containing protein [Pseudobacter sp.]